MLFNNASYDIDEVGDPEEMREKPNFGIAQTLIDNSMFIYSIRPSSSIKSRSARFHFSF